MNNIQRLAQEGNKNHRIFAATIVDLMQSQGFYGRLYRSVNEMDEQNYSQLYDLLERQNFKDPLDVVCSGWSVKTGGIYETHLLLLQQPRSAYLRIQR